MLQKLFNFKRPSAYCNLTILIYVLFVLYVINVAMTDQSTLNSTGDSIDYGLYVIYAAFIVPIVLMITGWAIYFSTPKKKKLPIYLIVTTLFAIFATYFISTALFG